MQQFAFQMHIDTLIALGQKKRDCRFCTEVPY